MHHKSTYLCPLIEAKYFSLAHCTGISYLLCNMALSSINKLTIWLRRAVTPKFEINSYFCLSAVSLGHNQEATA